jgi:hypothetical protein
MPGRRAPQGATREPACPAPPPGFWTLPDFKMQPVETTIFSDRHFWHEGYDKAYQVVGSGIHGWLTTMRPAMLRHRRGYPTYPDALQPPAPGHGRGTLSTGPMPRVAWD